MQTLIEYVPWIVFGLTYKFGGGIYPATAAIMGAMALILVYYWARTRKIPQVHLALTVIVWVFGAATLILRDARFMQWKATIIYWLIGIVLGASVWVGRMTLLERLIGKAIPEEVTVPASDWHKMSLLLGVFYLALGVVNIWVALTHSVSEWVTFKVWIAMPLGLLVLLGVWMWLLRGTFTKESSS